MLSFDPQPCNDKAEATSTTTFAASDLLFLGSNSSRQEAKFCERAASAQLGEALVYTDITSTQKALATRPPKS
jgi:hypothetical protein